MRRRRKSKSLAEMPRSVATDKQPAENRNRTRPAIPISLPIRFPINSERRLLPSMWERLEREIKCLQYPAQEFACQICCAHESANSIELKANLSRQRKELRELANELRSIGENLPEATALFAICEKIRSTYRPPGAPGSAWEVMRLMGVGDFVKDQKEYFAPMNRPDPAAPLENLANSIITTRLFLGKEITLLQARNRSAKSVLKSSPHMWLRGGGIYYLLERLYREGSVKPMTTARAHRKICALMRKLGCRLKFDEIKRYSSAIRLARGRMSRQYKVLCDHLLEQWVALPPKKH